MVAPWVTATSPLTFAAYHPLPSSSQKNLQKFSGDGKFSTDKHIKYFFVAINILRVSHEDVAVRLFVETLIEVTVDWFYHLANGSITSWDTMRTDFEARFKIDEDEHALLAHLTSMNKQPFISMRDFIASFNKITNRIPAANRPTMGNLKTFFISTMPPSMNFDLRRSCTVDLDVVQRIWLELEDDMISVGR